MTSMWLQYLLFSKPNYEHYPTHPGSIARNLTGEHHLGWQCSYIAKRLLANLNTVIISAFVIWIWITKKVNVISFTLAGKGNFHSNIWMRLLWLSHTTILPLLKIVDFIINEITENLNPILQLIYFSNDEYVATVSAVFKTKLRTLPPPTRGQESWQVNTI